MKSLALVTLIFLCGNIAAQENLVPNGSFEEFTVCPTGPNPWTVNNWERAVATPDYFNACISYPNEGSFLDTPCNNRGCQIPRTGDAYVGLFAFDRMNPNGGEFIQMELVEHLVSGIRYKVEFYVSPAEYYGYAVASLGAALTAYPPAVITTGSMQVNLDTSPQVFNVGNGPVTDTTAWTLICDTVVSRGGEERFISIGNFHSDLESDTLYFNHGVVGERAAYYYIDDVSVVALDSVPNSVSELEEEDNNGFSVYPNPSNGVVTIEYDLETDEPLTVQVYDLSGRSVYSASLNGEDAKAEVLLNGVPSGLYLLRVTVNGETKHSEPISVVRP